MWRKLLSWLRPRPRLAVKRPVTARRQGAVVHTQTGVALHFTLFGGGSAPAPKAPKAPQARKPPAAPRRSRLLDWAFGAPPPPPLTDAEARKLPLVPDRAAERRAILAEAERLTGNPYAGRTTIAGARIIAAHAARLTAAQAPAPAPTTAKVVGPKHAKPIRVKAHTRVDGTKVHAHTRVRPGEGTK